MKKTSKKGDWGMKNMKIDANGTEIMKMLTFRSPILRNIKIQTMPLSWWQTGCVIILRFHF